MKNFRDKNQTDLENYMSSILAEDLLYLLQIAEENEQKYDSKQLEKIYKHARIALDFDD